MNSPMNSRALAARAVAQVLAGASLDDALAAARRHCGERDLPLIKSMAYGVLREHAQLLALSNSLLQRPLENEPEISALLEVGFYQLRRMRIPPHAAVADTSCAQEKGPGCHGIPGLSSVLTRRP